MELVLWSLLIIITIWKIHGIKNLNMMAAIAKMDRGTMERGPKNMSHLAAIFS